LTESLEFKNRRSLRDQIERAAVSVSNNIAEGFERGTNRELLAFLYIARGSAGEVRSMLSLLGSMPRFRNLESGILNLKREVESISKQLGGWLRVLKDSDKDGQKFVNSKVRARKRQATITRRIWKNWNRFVTAARQGRMNKYSVLLQTPMECAAGVTPRDVS
jgi:four helix bundle protein